MSSTAVRQPYRATHLVTHVANLTGTRRAMLRAAFRAGLSNRNTGENVSKGVEWSGLGAMLAAGGVLGEKVVTHGIDNPLLAAAGFTFAAIGAITFNVGTFGRMTREQADYSGKLIKEDPLLAMNDVLGQGRIWDEMDAHLLGRGIESMTSYIKRNSDAMLNPAPAAFALEANCASGVREELDKLKTAAEAQRLLREGELRQSLQRTWLTVDRCVRFAYSEGMLQRGEPTAAMVDALALPAWRNLRRLGLGQPTLR